MKCKGLICTGLALASGMLMAAERISLDRGWAFRSTAWRGRAENWVSTGGIPEKVV